MIEGQVMSPATASFSCGIYQPVFMQSLRPYLDPGFLELDWQHNPTPALRELALHEHIYNSGVYFDHDLTGLLSPKFFSKTALTSSEVKEWIARNPGHELYCITGRPFVPYIAYNGIERAQRNRSLPEFEAKLRRLCAEIGYRLPRELGRQTNRDLLLCNYFVGTRSFWEKWSRDIVLPILEIGRKKSPAFRDIFAPTPYRSPTPVHLVVFFYERILSYYIQTKGIDAAIFPFSHEQILRVGYHPLMLDYLKRTMPWVDEIDRRGAWRKADRARLGLDYAALLEKISVVGHEAETFDPSNFDLPSRKPPKDSAARCIN